MENVLQTENEENALSVELTLGIEALALNSLQASELREGPPALQLRHSRAGRCSWLGGMKKVMIDHPLIPCLRPKRIVCNYKMAANPRLASVKATCFARHPRPFARTRRQRFNSRRPLCPRESSPSSQVTVLLLCVLATWLSNSWAPALMSGQRTADNNEQQTTANREQNLYL